MVKFLEQISYWFVNIIQIILRLFKRYPTFKWPTNSKVVTQAFGINPQYYGQYGLPGHEGIDMRAYDGTPITAVYDGVVKSTGWHYAYGNQIRIKHIIEGNEYESIYAHFKYPATLIAGTKIKKGQVIGYANSTGNSTGSHLHFGLKQFGGEKPDTEYQNKYEWPYNLIDPTLFFRELR